MTPEQIADLYRPRDSSGPGESSKPMEFPPLAIAPHQFGIVPHTDWPKVNAAEHWADFPPGYTITAYPAAAAAAPPPPSAADSRYQPPITAAAAAAAE